jgi:hypothetical protein
MNSATGVPVRQPYAGVDFIPQSGIYELSYWFGGVPEEEDAEKHGDEHENQRHNVATHSYSRQASLEYGGTRKSRQMS